MQADILIENIKQLITCEAITPKRHLAMQDVGLVEHADVAIKDGLIIGVGQGLSQQYTAEHVIEAGDKVVCPGFVDPHTHVVYAGDRINEFEMRIKGATYMEIMAAGGGIVSSMVAMRQVAVDELVAQTRPRLDRMLALGTTTVEIKSGYGLDVENELKMMEAMAILDQSHVVDIVPTFLGAHAIPPEYKGQEDSYTQLVIDVMLPEVAAWYNRSHFATKNTPLFVDVFCEQNAFTLEQSKRILAAGKALGMQVKSHVDEFTSLGGVTMSIEKGAVSVDHLDVTTYEDMTALAASNTIGVVIPAVNFNLGSAHFADARAMIDMGAAVALCTDINPGSAPCPSMPLVMAIACRYQKLLPAEAMNASTINAAYAVGMGDKTGSIEIGKQADLLILDTSDYRHIAYEFGGNFVKQVIKHGEIVHG